MCPKIEINLADKALRWPLSVIALCLSSVSIELYKQANTTKKCTKKSQTPSSANVLRIGILLCCMFLCALIRCIFVSMYVSWLPVFPCLRPIKVRSRIYRPTLKFYVAYEMRFDVISEYWLIESIECAYGSTARHIKPANFMSGGPTLCVSHVDVLLLFSSD